MSRIDEALRISESAGGVVTSEVAPYQPGHTSPFGQYGLEDAVAVEELAEAHKVSVPVPQVPVPASTPVALKGAGPKLPEDAALRARLVTSSSSTVSLEQYRRLAAVLHE